MATTKVMAIRESRIVNKIYLIRSKRVMLDFDLAPKIGFRRSNESE